MSISIRFENNIKLVFNFSFYDHENPDIVGFDMEDEDTLKAISSGSEDILKALSWAMNGGYEEAKLVHAVSLEICSIESNYGRTWDTVKATGDKRKISRFVSEFERYMEKHEVTDDDINLFLSSKMSCQSYVEFVGEYLELQKRKEEASQKKKIVGYVYLIEAENGLFKIGKAVDVQKRMKPFSVHFPMGWKLLTSFKSDDYSSSERNLHSMFAEKRDVGEWFKLLPEDVNYICSIQDGQL